MARKEISRFFAVRNEAWQRHDAAALAAGHAEDGEIDSPLWGTVKGYNAIENNYAQWFSSFPDARYSSERLLIDGNAAVQFTKMFGTQQGEFCGLAPSGKRFEMRCASVFSFEGGKIKREIRVYDFTGILVQVGVLKAKPAF